MPGLRCAGASQGGGERQRYARKSIVDVVNDSFIPKLYPRQQDSECRMVDRLLLQLVTSPIFLIVSSFSLFAIIVKLARDQQQKNARMERQRLKRRI